MHDICGCPQCEIESRNTDMVTEAVLDCVQILKVLVSGGDMALISFDPDVAVEYIPEYNSNREDDDPCVVMIKFVPYSKVQTYSRMIALKTKGMNGNAKIAEITQGIQRKQFLDSVEKIEGYSVNGKDVTEAGDFYDTADTDLIIEIIQAMESSQKLSEGQRKN